MTATAENIKSIVESAETMANIETLENDIPLVEQDVDSLDMANIYLLIEERFGKKILDDDLQQLKSINDIVEYVNNK